MKKTIKITIIILISLCLFACKDKYSLIDITSEEMANNLFFDKSSFILAFYKENQNNSKEFIKDLNYIIDTQKTNIYLMKIDEISNSDTILLEMYFDSSITGNSYIAVENSNVTVKNNYSNNGTLVTDMLKAPVDDTFKRVPDEQKQNSLTKAKEYFSEGKISQSYYELLKAITLKEAKDFYKENEIKYNLIGTWVSTKKNSKGKYDGIYVEEKENIYTKYSAKDSDLNDVDYDNKKTVYFKVLDDIIYTCETEKVDYKKAFKIVDMTKDNLTLLNLKNNKTIEYIKKG